MRRGVDDQNPDYVRERIEETDNLGQKYLAGIALSIGLIAFASFETELHDAGASPPVSVASRVETAAPVPVEPIQLCTFGGASVQPKAWKKQDLEI